jgi:chaperone required for assembly of F1-ATPase
MSSIPPLDPRVAARKGFRESEDRPRRFWKTVDVVEVPGGWRVLLDGRAPKTPAGAGYDLPTLALARLVASEWEAQGEFLVPATMPATRLAATAIDRIEPARAAVAQEIAAYAGTDLLCYPVEHPTPLRNHQDREWQPWRQWAEDQGVKLEVACGLQHQTQPPASLERVRILALELDTFTLAALATVVPLLGSAVLGLALKMGALSGSQAFELSRLDEAFQEAQWGVDEEASLRTQARRAEAELMESWFKALAHRPDQAIR